MKQPCYLGLEDARQVLAEMGVKLSHTADAARGGTGRAGTTQAAVLRRSHRAQTQNREGRFTERVFQTAGGSAEKPAPKLNRIVLKLAFMPGFIALFAMADIRKRNGSKGITYQVRYPNKASKTGYAYKTFATLKEAREFRESCGQPVSKRAPLSSEIRTVAAGPPEMAGGLREGRPQWTRSGHGRHA